MSRLIDADLLTDVIKNIQDHMREVNKNPVLVDAREIFTLFIEMVEKQSTAYDLEAVMKELKEKAFPDFEEEYTCNGGLLLHYDDVIEIGRNGGVK